jgi:fructose-1,6-bisphosphatase/inositol monophosphatase family enzyme
MKRERYPKLDYLRKLAFVAGKIITDNFGKVKSETKKDGTPLTVADTSINDLVIDNIYRDFPEVSIISEEGNHEVSSARYRVICDPLDGTIPFVMGLPISSFCISVLEGNTPLIGVIYDPFCKRMWHAIQGKGSFLNEEKIQVSQCSQVNDSQICLTWWKNSSYNMAKVCARLIEASATWINPLSGACLGGLIASGTLDGVIFPGQMGWETAAMQVIVEEAGGKVTDIYGNKMVYGSKGEIQGHIISNGFLHEKLVEIVAKCQ